MSYSGKFKDKNNNLHPVTSVLYGTCDTAAATAAKVVTCADFDTLMTGVTIRVKFDNANTSASPTVNINSTGAKSVYRFGSTAPVDGDSWKAGEVVDLLYDGTSFFMVSADDIGSKQDALTFDNAPTDGSNNPVKSNGIYDSEKDIYAAMGKNGAKNFIPYPYSETTKTINGITYTDNGDGTITANGTALDTANFILADEFTFTENESYILTGCPSGGGANTYRQYIIAYGGDVGKGRRITPTSESGLIKQILIQVFGGTTVSNLTFKPMLRLASDTDDTYQPYAKTNKQLTDDVALLESGKTDTDMVAADFDATASYTAGNYCVQDGKLYKFKNNHSGAWSAADVDEVKIAGELSALKSGLIAKIDQITVGEVIGAATFADFILGVLSDANLPHSKLTVLYAIYPNNDYYVFYVLRLYEDVYTFIVNSTSKMYHGKAITGQNYVEVYEVTSSLVTN